MVKFVIKLKTWIPQGEILFSDDGINRITYGGDGRQESWSGTNRTLQQFTIDTSDFSVTPYQAIGTTHQYVYNYVTKRTSTYTDKAPVSDLTYTKRIEGGYLYLDCKCSSANPLQVGAPPIDYEFTLKVTRDGTMRITGRHDGFPGYELWKKIDGGNPKLMWSHNPTETGETPISLFAPMEHSVDKNVGQ